MRTADELLELIKQRVDPDLLVEMLELSTEDLVIAFEDKILYDRYRFSDLEDEEYDGE
jgi:hypothetical protein